MQSLLDIINNVPDASHLPLPMVLAVQKSPQYVSTKAQNNTAKSNQQLYRVYLCDPLHQQQPAITAIIPKEKFPNDINPETLPPGTLFNISKCNLKDHPKRILIISNFTIEVNNNQQQQQSTTSTTHDAKPAVQRSNNPPPSNNNSNVKAPSFSVNNPSNSNNTVNNQQVNRNQPQTTNTFNKPQQQHTATSSNNNPVQNRNPQQTFNRPNNPTNPQPRQSLGNVPLKTKQALPLIGITPWASDWVIKVRVTKKGDLKKWSNPPKEGCLYSLDLIDEDGTEIRATFFSNKFYDQIESGKVYFMKGGKAKQADRKYSKLPHNYELTFYDNSIIEEAEEDQAKNIPQGKFDFTPLEDLKNLPKDKKVVDIVGAVKTIGESETMTIKAKETNGVTIPEKQTCKREITVINKDPEGKIYEVSVTLWGEENVTFNVGDSVIFTCLSVKEFRGGVKLSSSKSSKILTNFDLPQSRRVMDLFSTLETPIEEIKGISLSATVSSGSGFKRYFLADLDTVKVEDLEKEKEYKTKTFFIRSHFSFFKDGDLTYGACPNEGCKSKKLQKNELDTSYKCPTCHTQYDETSSVHKFMTTVMLSDHTCSKHLTAFDKGMATILNVDANTYFESDDALKDDYKANAQSKTATFMIRAGIQNNDQGSQVRFSFVGVKEIDDWAKEAKGCLGTINAYCRNFGI